MNESLIALIKTSNADKRAIALVASKNHNSLPVRISIGELTDTILNVDVEPYFPKENKTSINGTCAQLINIFAHSDNSINMKKGYLKGKNTSQKSKLKTRLGYTMNSLKTNILS